MSTPKAPYTPKEPYVFPVKTLQGIGHTATDLAKNVEWEGADELAKKLNDLETAAADFPKEGQEEAADQLVKVMQDLGDAAADLAKRAKGQANAAEAERDNAKKATTKGKAREAAGEAEKYRHTAEEQALWVDAVAKAVQLASKVIIGSKVSGPKKQNAQSVATKVAVDARTAKQYVERAQNAVEAAVNIANTA